MKYLIVGLGNIGAEYENTRHNIGFEIVNELCKKFDAGFKAERLADIAELNYKGRRIYLAKPSTYMNLSGKAVRYWKDELKLQEENILIIYDDIALPLGKLRVRNKGSDGGHNGIKDIIEKLGTSVFPRLRVGIGNNFPRGKQVDFVLGTWTGEETTLLPDVFQLSIEVILSFTTQGLTRTMNQFN